jgi:membrane protein
MKKLKRLFTVLKNAIVAFIDDDCVKLSASLSYYTIFAMAPLLLIVISLTGVFFGKDAVRGRVREELGGLIGSSAAQQIEDIIINIQQSHHTFAGAIIGGIILFVGATGVFTEIQGSINYIWSVKAKPKRGWRKYLINRLLSFSLVLGLGFILLVSLIVNALLALMNTKLIKVLPNTTVYLFYMINTAIILIVITGLFAVIFKILPDAIISWRDALVGSSFTAVLFILGKFLIGLYLGKANLGVTYGAAASIVIILSWVYYSSLILYFGAEFTKVFALFSGHGIKPKKTAVFIIKRESAEIPSSRLDT